MKKITIALLIILLIFCTVSCNGDVDSLLSLRDVSIVLSSDRHKDADGNSNLPDLFALVKADTTVTQPSYAVIDGDLVDRESSSPTLLAAPPEGGGPGGGGPGGHEENLTYSLLGVTEEIAGIFGDDIKGIYTYGSHDDHCTDAFSEFLTGPYDAGNFYFYGITYCQMEYNTKEEIDSSNYDGLDLGNPYGNYAEIAAENFLEYANSLTDEKPMIIISHVPLHANRGDNPGGITWIDAINEVCKKRACIFVWGHNHTIEGEHENEQDYYLKTVGQTLTVQNGVAVNKNMKQLIKQFHLPT